MLLKRTTLKRVTLGLILVAAVGAGSVSIAQSMADSHHQSQLKSKHEFPQNEEGQAYGSAAEAESFDDIPDLVSAVGVDGAKGYIKSSDMFGDEPKNPQEAIERQKNRIPGTRYIPLYASDGETVIGKFKIEVPGDNSSSILTVNNGSELIEIENDFPTHK